MLKTLMRGQDCKVTTTITGALHGALSGYSSLPRDWVTQLPPKQTVWLNSKINHLLDLMAIPWKCGWIFFAAGDYERLDYRNYQCHKVNHTRHASPDRAQYVGYTAMCVVHPVSQFRIKYWYQQKKLINILMLPLFFPFWVLLMALDALMTSWG